MRQITSAILVGALLAACGQSEKFPLQGSKLVLPPPVVGDAPPANPVALPALSYRSDSARGSSFRDAKVFLVAGTRDGVVYAREVIEQKRLWLRSGLSESDISCYYVIPPEAVLRREAPAYRDLASELASCYPAHAGTLSKHITLASRQTQADYVYVFVSSQAGQPPSIILEDPRMLPQREALERIIRRLPVLDQFLVRMDAMEDGSSPPFTAFLEALGTKKSQPEDLLFSPRYFKQALSAWPDTTPKYVVLNGSYTGGFITDVNAKFPGELNRGLSQLTVLTSANWDEPNPSPASSDRQTLFGTEYHRSLEAALLAPNKLPWKTLASQLRQRVSDAQRARRSKHPANPQLFISP